MIAALETSHPSLVVTKKVVTTQGDKILDKPLPEIGGSILFRNSRVNCSLALSTHFKDLPVESLDGGMHPRPNRSAGCADFRGRNMRIVQPGLFTICLHKSFLQADLPGPDGLDLAAL